MLNIGEFARLADVSVRMLRHYDQLDLLRPQRVDPHTGYRLYSAAQLDRANQLIALKDLGFTLEEVGRMLDGTLAARTIAGMLRERRAQLQEQIHADTRRLHSVDARLRTIEKENPMTAFIEKELPELTLVQLSERIAEMSEIEDRIGPMFTRVNEAIAAAGATYVGPGVATYTTDHDGTIAAAAEQIAGAEVPAGLERAVVSAVPRALTVRYAGDDLSGITQAWQGLVAEVETRGLRAVGTCREVYERTPFDGPDVEGWIVDLQQPVA